MGQPSFRHHDTSRTYTLWEHNTDIVDTNPDSPNFGIVINRNIFYAPTQFITQIPEVVELEDYFTPSQIDVLFNDAAGSVKSFSTVSYEGSQGRIIPFTSESYTDENGNTGPYSGQWRDGEHYNLSKKDGWYVSDVETDQSSFGNVGDFVPKEGKWYNRISGGLSTGIDRQINDGGVLPSEYLNEFSVQGIGTLLSTPNCEGDSVSESSTLSEDGLTEYITTTTTTCNEDGTTTTTTTTTTVTTNPNEGNTNEGTTTTETNTSTETDSPVMGVITSPEGNEEGEVLDF